MRSLFAYAIALLIINTIWHLFWGYVCQDMIWEITLYRDVNPASVIPRFCEAFCLLVGLFVCIPIAIEFED